MKSPNTNCHRPRLDQLEDRCIPGSVLDLLASPLLGALGGLSLDPVQAARTAVALLSGQTTAAPTQAAPPGYPITAATPYTPQPLETLALQPPSGDSGADILLAAVAGSTSPSGSVVSAFAQSAQGVQVIWGESAIVDGSRIATWALVAAHDHAILAIGASFSVKLAENMPEPGSGPAGAIATLDYPALVKDTTFFNHLEMHSNLHGHEAPPGSINPDRNRVPHFDFHFYGVPEEQVWDIPDVRPPLPAVPADHLLTGYTQPGRSVLQMGRHSGPIWALTDPNPLTTIMLLGYLPDGSQMHFLEPMVSQEVLLGRQDFTLPAPMPQTFGREMLYPTQFQATYQGDAWSFVFSDFVDVT